jgi:hypothetical protein
MRKRIIGVAAVGLVALGIWLANWWKGPGLGGSGTGDETQVNLQTESQSPPARPSSPAAGDGQTSLPGPPPDVLTVMIAGSEYRVQANESAAAEFAPASLSKVVEQATEVPGDTQGIRVRVLRHVTAQQGARSDLFEALQQAGIKREEIVEVSDFVE